MLQQSLFHEWKPPRVNINIFSQTWNLGSFWLWSLSWPRLSQMLPSDIHSLLVPSPPRLLTVSWITTISWFNLHNVFFGVTVGGDQIPTSTKKPSMAALAEFTLDCYASSCHACIPSAMDLFQSPGVLKDKQPCHGKYLDSVWETHKKWVVSEPEQWPQSQPAQTVGQ